MRRWLETLGVALFALVALCGHAYAQEGAGAQAITVSACGTAPNTPKVGNVYSITMDTNGNLCVSSGGGGGGNVTITGPLGTGSAATGVRTTLDSTDAAALQSIVTNTGAATPAGANIIGQVGIDQTTDGTTNRVVPPLTRVKVLTGSLTLSSSATYTNGVDIGGKISVAIGIGNAVQVCVDYVATVDTGTSMTTGISQTAMVFSGTLAGTFTDGSAVSWGSGDGGKLIYGVAQSSTTAIGNGAMSNRGSGAAAYGGPPSYCGLTDSSGNLTLTWASSATPSYTGTTTRGWTMQVRY